MKRGTTPTLTFELPFESNQIKNLNIAFSQKKDMKFSKEKDDCELSENQVKVKLTQSDTLSLDKGSVNIQMRVLTKDDNALASDIINVEVEDILKEGII